MSVYSDYYHYIPAASGFGTSSHILEERGTNNFSTTYKTKNTYSLLADTIEDSLKVPLLSETPKELIENEEEYLSLKDIAILDENSGEWTKIAFFFTTVNGCTELKTEEMTFSNAGSLTSYSNEDAIIDFREDAVSVKDEQMETIPLDEENIPLKRDPLQDVPGCWSAILKRLGIEEERPQ